MIPDALLKRYGARIRKLRKNEVLFEQGATATDFAVVRSGRIKMHAQTGDGREFVQGYFGEGQSFGEPPFFMGMPYPAAAVAVVPSEVWICPRQGFLRLLRENPDVHLAVTQSLSSRLIYKSIMLTEIAVEEAEHRLTTLIEHFRRADPAAARTAVFRVPFTRQQMADMTGLRVETVIRTVKAMEQRRLLTIDADGKILWKHIHAQRKDTS